MADHPWYSDERNRELDGKGKVKTRVERFHKEISLEIWDSVSSLNIPNPSGIRSLCAVCFYDLIWFYLSFENHSRTLVGHGIPFWKNTEQSQLFQAIRETTKTSACFYRTTVPKFLTFYEHFCLCIARK